MAKIFRCNPVRLALSADARLLAIGTFHARTMTVWDLEGQNGKSVLLHEEQFANGAIVAFSPDGRWLSCSGRDEIRVLDTASWKVVACWPRKVWHLGNTTFSADSKLLLIQHSPVRDFLNGITLSPSGRWLTAAGGYEGARWLWDLHALERELRSLGLGWSD